MKKPLSVVMLGASGAVGGLVVRELLAMPEVGRVTLLNRRDLDELRGGKLAQHTVDVFKVATYAAFLPGHDCAICCLGVGQPSKVSKEEFVRVDKTAVIAFASACKDAGVKHFELLSAVGANARSSSFYLKTKGELQDAIAALHFERVSFFQPSMILTPSNRYGLSQAVLLKTWPLISKLLLGPLRSYRGIPIANLAKAMATNILASGAANETLRCDQMNALAEG
jgi:uncharacterized protein YbjT (DUF2867 family)